MENDLEKGENESRGPVTISRPYCSYLHIESFHCNVFSNLSAQFLTFLLKNRKSLCQTLQSAVEWRREERTQDNPIAHMWFARLLRFLPFPRCRKGRSQNKNHIVETMKLHISLPLMSYWANSVTWPYTAAKEAGNCSLELEAMCLTKTELCY